MAKPKIAVLGAGAMGEALVRGLLRAGWSTEDIALAVRRQSRCDELVEKYGCAGWTDPVAALEGADVGVVAVKPNDVTRLLDQLVGNVEHVGLWVSVAAGVPTSLYEEHLGDVAVIRAMPNTPALVDEGITGICAGRFADAEALAAAEEIFDAVGEVLTMDERLLDAVTAVSGTGPAYAFLLAEALTEAALREGIPRDLAEALVHQTIRGAGALLVETPLSPAELRAQVTSPGGTTAAAVHVLEERGFRALVEDAVRAAAIRSRQLGEAADS